MAWSLSGVTDDEWTASDAKYEEDKINKLVVQDRRMCEEFIRLIWSVIRIHIYSCGGGIHTQRET